MACVLDTGSQQGSQLFVFSLSLSKDLFGLDLADYKQSKIPLIGVGCTSPMKKD